MKPDHSIALKPASELSRMKVIIDTREQTPWHFPMELVEVRRDTLNYGDYALDGDTWAIERKSLPDFVGTVTAGWERFCRELERMPKEPQRVIIVGGSITQIMSQDYNGSAKPKYVMRRIAELTMMGVSVLFCDNETFAAMTAYRLFRRRKAFLDGVEDLSDSAD